MAKTTPAHTGRQFDYTVNQIFCYSLRVILPYKLSQLVIWWFVDAPKILFLIGKRLTTLINNSLSFTLNVRLLLTPLFGDKTLVGRGIGIVVRIVEILVGLVLMLALLTANLATPIVWFLLPLILIHYIQGYTILVYLALTVFWLVLTRNTPFRRVKKAMLPKSYLLAFRPGLVAQYRNVKTLLRNPKITYLLQKAELTNPSFETKLTDTKILGDKETILRKAYEYAQKQDSRYVEPEQLFLAMMASIDNVDALLAIFDSDLTTLEQSANWVVTKRENRAKMYIWQPDYEMLFTGGIGRGMTGHVTPYLDAASEDFTRMAKNGKIGKIVDREKDIERIAQVLSGTKENILIIGEPGSGKTTIVKGMAFEVIAGNKYKTLTNKRIVSLELGGLISGTATSGQLAEKIKKVMDEAKSSADIIIFIDEIHTLVAGSDDGKTVFAILEPYFASGDLQVIGATSIPNYRKYIEPNGAFARLFQILEIKEATKEDSAEILKDLAGKLETQRRIVITYPAIAKTVALSEQLIHERVLPDKAIDILSRAVTRVAETSKLLTSVEITKEVTEITHIPVEAVSRGEAEKLMNVEAEMKKMVIGQDHALSQIASALKRARMGMRNTNKPIASFLFVGTTGVGKTQTAKALAKVYFGNSKTLIRLDMSEYQQVDSINRLIGTPDGDNKGILTEAVRTSPYALILLDEIEKAHQNIIQTFLQVLDDGRLTDSSGRTVDFTNTIIIATSNAGTRAIQDIVQKSGSFDEMVNAALGIVREKFSPEFLNRFNGIITFRPLTTADLKQIALLQLTDVKEMAKQKGIKITFKDSLVDELVKRGYTPDWGARPLNRVIEDSVETYLAEKMLTGTISKGQDITLGTEVFSN